MLRILAFILAGAMAAMPAAPPGKIFPYAYDQHDFPNGLRLVTIPTDYPNVVSVFIVVQTGSRNEVEPGKSGFAHLFEHMMFRGTKAYPPAKYEAVLRSIGAASNAYTTDDHTAYHTTFSKEDLEAVLRMEADRFQNLDYAEQVFRTETLAVLGEYNKNSASPISKLYEVLRDTAFDRHTYKHTTMGFLRDIEDMPSQFEYSRQFFHRYYRPEYTTIVVAGDVTPDATRSLVAKYWGEWQRGSFRPDIPAEPPQTAPRANRIDWPTPTMPWIAVAFHAPAYSDIEKDQAAMDLISYLGFSENSDLYQKLVIQEQKTDVLGADTGDHVDPELFTIVARVKKAPEMDSVRDAILSTVEQFKQKPVEAARLAAIKRRLRYEFALRLNNSESVAASVARFVALRRTPDTIDRLYSVYSSLTPEDIQAIAQKYFGENNRTIVTLTGGKAQ